VRDPVKWKQTEVMQGTWRLVNGRELYDISNDPAQEQNVFDAHPDRVARLRAFYDAWWAELEPTFAQTTEIYLGHPAHPVVTLTGHDWIQEALPPWNQQHIRQAYGFGVPSRGAAQGSKAARPPPSGPAAAG
jgi:arylsulfatase B